LNFKENMLIPTQVNPKLVDRKDDDERLPIHWATSYGHLDIAILLSAGKNFDPDVQVHFDSRFILYAVTFICVGIILGK
jgi:hypothetical protein